MRIFRFVKIKKTLQKGFTIIELLVVIAIMAVITSIVLFNNRDLNSSILVSNTAYEINLLVREAQAYGLGVRGTGDTSDDFRYAQGVFFDTIQNDRVILFSDKDGNGSFTPNSEEIQIYALDTDRAGRILSLCRPSVGGACDPVGTTASVLFKRPNPESIFNTENGPANDNGPLVINTGFAGVQGMCRSIIIQKTGAIQVNTQYCF